MKGGIPVEKEGYKQVWIPEALYNELQAHFEEEKTHPSVAQKPKPIGPGGCSLVVVVYPDGRITYRCGGSCGIFDWFLGRSCNRQITGNPDGTDLNVFCTCGGGWFDRIFG
jgi:hypothetical protein